MTIGTILKINDCYFVKSDEMSEMPFCQFYVNFKIINIKKYIVLII
jgi:hypothetical protein